MFASQAALVIANARRYRDEQRARADLGDTGEHRSGGRCGYRRQDRASPDRSTGRRQGLSKAFSPPAELQGN